MHSVKYNIPAKLTGLTFIVIMLSGCYSFSENQFCPFGMGFREDTDFSTLVIVDRNDNQISRKEQKSILKESHIYSSKVINDTYDLAEYLCTNKGLPDEKYKQLENIAEIYIYSGVVYAWTYSENGKVQRESLLQSLKNNDEGRIISGTLCGIGLCTRTDHEMFCKSRERTKLENKELKKSLSNYYLAQKEYKSTYPNKKTMTYCKGPKW